MYEIAGTLAYDNHHGGNVLHPNPSVIAVPNPYNQLFVESDAGYTPDDHSGVQTDVTTLMIPGLNCDYEDELAASLSRSYGHYSRMTRLHLGNKGIDVDDVSELARTVAEDVMEHGSRSARNKKLILHGHSMGGLLACRIAAKLTRDHGITPALITLDCSPMNAGDSRDGKAENILRVVNVLKAARYEGGEWSRTALEFYNELHNEHGSIQSALAVAERSGEPDKPSARLVTSELQILGTSLAGHEIDILQQARMPIHYLMPSDETRDNTVMTRQASQAYNNLFPAQVQTHTIPGGGHANPNECRGYDQVLQDMLHHMRFERYNEAAKRQSLGAHYPLNPHNIPR